MTNVQALVLGLALVAGAAAHGFLTRREGKEVHRAPEPTEKTDLEAQRIQTRSMETLALIQNSRSQVLQVGDRPLLVHTDWNQDGGNFKMTVNYYELKDSKLVLVPLTQAAK